MLLLVIAPCQGGASVPSVPRRTSDSEHLGRSVSEQDCAGRPIGVEGDDVETVVFAFRNIGTFAAEQSYEAGRRVRMAADQVAARCGSEPVGEARQLAGVVEPGLNTEALGDRFCGIPRTLEIRRVDVGEYARYRSS